jgi:VanZ family protein
MLILLSRNPEQARLRPRNAPQNVSTWLPPLIAALVIAAESTSVFSAENTSGWLRPFFEHLFGHMTDTFWGELHFAIRKTGHFIGYGMVCLTFLRAWLRTLASSVPSTAKRWRLLSCELAVFSTVVIASLDEWHQHFLPSRTGRIQDVGIDTAGALVACLVIEVISLTLAKRQSR